MRTTALLRHAGVAPANLRSQLQPSLQILTITNDSGLKEIGKHRPRGEV